jgi:hypothetical protein
MAAGSSRAIHRGFEDALACGSSDVLDCVLFHYTVAHRQLQPPSMLEKTQRGCPLVHS